MTNTKQGIKKVFSNLDVDPRNTLKLVEMESILWTEAQDLNLERTVQYAEIRNLPTISKRWCFTDSSWKDK